MSQVKMWTKHLDSLDEKIPKKDSLTALVERMATPLQLGLYPLLKCDPEKEDPKTIFQGLSKDQQQEIRRLYQRKDQDARLIRKNLGDLDKKLSTLLKEEK